MGGMINAWDNILGAANVVTAGIDQGLEKQAKLDLNTRQLKLQEDINKKLNEFDHRSDYENWSQEIDDLFTKTTSEMSDKNSEYYCRNNLTARMFDEVLQNARVQTQQKTSVLVGQFQTKKNWTDFSTNIDRIHAMYKGQDAFDQDIIALNDLKNVESVDPMKEEELKTTFYQRAVKGVYEDNYEELKKSAMADGKSADEVWNDLDRISKDVVTRKDENGFPIPNYGSGEYRKGLKQDFIQMYNAEQAAYQRENANVFTDDIVDIRGDINALVSGAKNAKPVREIIARINTGHDKLEVTGNGQLGNGVKNTLSKEYKALLNLMEDYEKAVKNGAGTGKTNAPSFESVFCTKGFTESYLQMIENGTFHDNYAAAAAMQDELIENWFGYTWKEEKLVDSNGVEREMTDKEKLNFYNTHYKQSSACDLLNSTVLKEKLKTHFPSVLKAYDNVVKDIEADIKNNPDPKKRKYSPEAAGFLAAFIDDAMAGAGRDTKEGDLLNNLNVMLNAVTMDGLKGLFNGKGLLESQQKYLGRTAQELKDNDVLITDDYRNTMTFAPGTEEKIKAIAQDQRNYIASQLGVDLNDEWTYVATRNDRQPIPVFTDDKGHKYLLEPVGNGKGVRIVNEQGEDYSVISKDERRSEYNKNLALNYADRAVQNEAIKEKEDSEEQSMNETLRATETIPSLVKQFGQTDMDSWTSEAGAMMNRSEAFSRTVKKLDSLAKDKKYSEEDFKQLTGITKKQWKEIKDNSEKYKIISNS